jgi:nucleoside 2-deoxyribosyltransferase
MSPAIYLTGSTLEPRSFTEGKPDWRSIAMTRLQRSGISVINPLDLVFAHADEFFAADPTVRKALDLIDQCDAVLANLIKPSYGTAMEIFYAHRQGKMVTVVGNSPFSPWVLSHSKARFERIEPAIEYLIGETPLVDPVAWCLQHEHSLSNRYEEFPRSGEPDYQFFGGELPILVVAPHATACFREGEFKEPDVFTGSIAALLNRTARNHSLASSYCLAADPYWHLQTPLRKAFNSIIKSGKIRLVIFLLGAPWQQTPGIQVRVRGPQSSNFEHYGSALRYQLSKLEPVVEDQYPEFADPLFKYTADELQVCSIEVRLHKHYRMPRLEPQPFQRLIELLNDFIVQTGQDFLRGN